MVNYKSCRQYVRDYAGCSVSDLADYVGLKVSAVSTMYNKNKSMLKCLCDGYSAVHNGQIVTAVID